MEDLVPYFKEFFSSDAMRDYLQECVAEYPEKKSVEVDYSDLQKDKTAIADLLLKNPDVVVRAAESAVEAVAQNLPNPPEKEKKFTPHVRFYNLPSVRGVEVEVQQLGSEHLNKLVRVEGIVNWITVIKPLMKTALWECVHCGTTIKTASEKNIIKQPGLCSCGRKDSFKLVEKSSEFNNLQRGELQDPIEKLRGSTPASNVELWLEDDLVNKITPGERVIVTGILRLRPERERNGKTSSVYAKFFDVLHVQKSEREFEELTITKEEEEKIIALSKNPKLFELIIQSIAPSIYGYDELKQAIALQLFGGTPGKVQPDGEKIRSDLHVLLVGDPGTAKSSILEYVNLIAPKSVLVSGGSASGVGLTAAAERDKEGEGWILKAGALVLANGGIAIIDEFDKMCLAGDSLVYLGNGLIKPIKEIFEENAREGVVEKKAGGEFEVVRVRLPVFTHRNGKITEGNATAVTRRKTSEVLYEVTLRSGKKITASGNHPLLINAKGELEYKRVSELSKGQFAVCPSKVPSPHNAVEIIPPLKTRFTKIASPELEVNENLGRLLGYLASEGSASANPMHGSYRIDFTNYSPEVSQHYKDTAVALGFEPHTPPSTPHSIRINSKNFVQTMNNISPSFNTGAVKNKKRFASLDTVPNIGRLIANARKKIGLRGFQLGLSRGTVSVFENDLKSPSKKSLKKIINALEAHPKAGVARKEIEKLKFFANCELYFDEIISITEKENQDGWIYNLSVENDKNFIANGIIVHNSDEDRGAMHQGMEQQMISIAKAGIVTKFPSRTSVLAAANPKLGRFDPTQPPSQQFDISPALMSRFDLIFAIRDVLDETRDREMADHILLGHRVASDKKKAEELPQDSPIKPRIEKEFLQKYIAYSRKTVFPILTDAASEKIKDFYVDLRRLGAKQNTFPVTARQIEGIIRLAEASAKARLSQRVEEQDAERAINLVHHVLNEVFVDKETGKLDSDVIYIGQSKSKIDDKRNKTRILTEIVSNLEKKLDLVSIDEVVKEAVAMGLEEHYTRQLLETLSREGEFYNPKTGFIKSARKREWG